MRLSRTTVNVPGSDDGFRLRSLLPSGDTLPESLWRSRHRFLVALLVLHGLLIPVFGIARGYGVGHSVSEGTLLPLILAAVAMVPAGGRKIRASALAVGLLTCSALFVHFSGGYIEAHFHFFVMIVILALYEDWLPFLLAVGFVFIHHGVAGALDPGSVYNHPDAIAHPWRWAALHAAAVSFAGILSVASWRMNEELRAQKDAVLTELSLQGEELRERSRELGEANAVLQELDRIKSEFIAVASHELRTPVTTVAGFAETLDFRWEEVDDATKRSLATTLAQQGQRLRRLTHDLLDLSRLEVGALEPDLQPLDVAEALAAATESFPELAVHVQCPAGLRAVADPEHVHRIVSNYVANAGKYGKPPFSVDACCRNGHVVIRVIDHGNGIPESFVPRLFEKFSRERSSDGDGAGLGLAIVRGLARANGGDAWYEPTSAETCFAASIRVEPAAAPATPPRNRRAPSLVAGSPGDSS